MRALRTLALVAAALAVAGAAPESSPRPMQRPGPAVVSTSGPAKHPAPDLRPRLRPDMAAQAPAAHLPKTVVLVASGAAVGRSIRPEARPENLKRKQVVLASGALVVPPDPGPKLGKKGAICGSDSIRGQRLKPIAGRLKGCGVAEPVQVTAVSGVALSTPATMDCTTAKALDAWVRGAVIPAVGDRGGGVASLQVAAHYVCRGRNNRSGAKISEHGKGHAIDISAIVLKNGVAMTVLKGWHDAAQGRILKAVHKAACGPFGTVLGPNSDGYHRDHLHLDTARYRKGSYCR